MLFGGDGTPYNSVPAILLNLLCKGHRYVAAPKDKVFDTLWSEYLVEVRNHAFGPEIG